MSKDNINITYIIFIFPIYRSKENINITYIIFILHILAEIPGFTRGIRKNLIPNFEKKKIFWKLGVWPAITNIQI